VLTARLSPSGTNFRNDSDYIAFYQKVMNRVSNLPGVVEVGTINTLPLSKGPTTGFQIEGRPLTTPDKWPGANYRSVSPSYFRAMNIPLVQGRAFTEHDNQQSPLTMIVNQALADHNFPGENPIGKRVNFGSSDSNRQLIWFEIVGVVANVRSLELKEEPSPELYFSSLQDPFQRTSLVIRSSVEPSVLTASIRQVVADVDKSVPVSDITTMEHIVSESVTQPRFNLFIVGVFGGIAMLLSAAGIYGVTAYTVTQRTHELGIRLALGAQVGDVLRMILGQGMAVISCGLLIGLGASFGLMRLMKGLLFGVSTTDPVTFITATLLLMLVALVACYVPARRATKVDPLEALRYE
jgi:putative ABC transport system permease protein